MPEFDFGSLIDKDEKQNKKTEKTAVETDEKQSNKRSSKSKRSKVASEKRQANRRTSRRSYRTSNQKILEKLEKIEEKLNILTDTLEVENLKDSVAHLREDMKPARQSGGQDVGSNSVKSDNTKLIPTTVLQMPSIEDLGGITNSIGKVEWSNMLDVAHDYGWLFNIYTLTRFLEKVDQTLIESGHKRLKLRSKWHKLEEKGAFLSRLGLDWKKQSLQRVGKTKSDIIDCFAKFNNKPRTSMAVFDYLSQVDPEHYDKQRENDIDLLRVRNVISRLNRAGYIEKIKGEQGVRYFKLNLVVSER